MTEPNPQCSCSSLECDYCQEKRAEKTKMERDRARENRTRQPDSYLSDWSNIIERQSAERRDLELQAEQKAIAELPDQLELMRQATTDFILDLYVQSKRNYDNYHTRRRTRALYRIIAHQCRKEILRRTARQHIPAETACTSTIYYPPDPDPSPDDSYGWPPSETHP